MRNSKQYTGTEVNFAVIAEKTRLTNQHTVIADNRQIKFLYRGFTIYNFPVLERCHFLVNFRNALIISKDSSCLMIRYSTTSYAI